MPVAIERNTVEIRKGERKWFAVGSNAHRVNEAMGWKPEIGDRVFIEFDEFDHVVETLLRRGLRVVI